jgi:glyoxylase-like metal-dependent hydrolase (beta-lactamase superfamily II)
MELASGVEIIETSFWGRPLNLTLFWGREVALVDTGLVGTPAESVIPYLNSIGLTPQDLSLIIITHAHADHFGGNEELWLASGKRVRFAAHRLDRAWIEDPPGQTRQAYGHYVELGLMSADDLENGIKASGDGVQLDYVLDGGEVFDLGSGLELEIVFAPGHSAGNICVLDRKNKVLVQGETIAGVAQYNVEGDLLTAPFYEDVEVYLRTIAVVARLDFETLLPSHLPLMNRKQAVQFLEDSLNFTLRFDEEVRQRLKDSSQPVSSMELLQSMDNLWGQYPADLGLYMLLETHLKGLVKQGLVGGSLAEGLTWVGPDRDDLGPLAQEARVAIEERHH